MKRLVSIGMLLASSMVAAGQQVQVTGTGYNLEEARTDAIQKALMKACKSAVVSDKVVRNFEPVQNKVIIYNGCLVKDFTVLRTEVDTLTKVTIKAEVIQNNLPDRIIKKSDEWFFYDFDQYNNRTAQLRIRLENAINLIKEVFLDYPIRAYNLEHKDPYITYQYNGVGTFNVDVVISWNLNFINSMASTFEILQDRSSSKWVPSSYNMRIERSWKASSYGFENKILQQEIYKSIFYNQPVIRIRLLNNKGVEVVKQCFNLKKLYWLYNHSMDGADYTGGPFWINFFSENALESKLSFDLPSQLPKDVEMNIDIVNNSFC